jgi:hypothetical protein
MQATMDGSPAPILASKPGAVYMSTMPGTSVVGAPQNSAVPMQPVTPGVHTVTLQTSPETPALSFTTHAVVVTGKTETTVVHPRQPVEAVFTVAGAQGMSGYTVNVNNDTPGTLKTPAKMQYTFDEKKLAESPVVTFTVHGVAKQQGQFALSWNGTALDKPVAGTPVAAPQVSDPKVSSPKVTTAEQPSHTTVSMPEARRTTLGTK